MSSHTMLVKRLLYEAKVAVQAGHQADGPQLSSSRQRLQQGTSEGAAGPNAGKISGAHANH